MNNKIEILRAVCFDEEDIKNIKNFGDSFSEKEIEFMVEFKKIYELGTDQLEKFITKLDEEGKDLDTYSIVYYVQLLLNGPFGSHTREFSQSEDKKYFTDFPDVMGMSGNLAVTPQNNTVYKDIAYQLGCAVDSYNKLPDFIQQTLTDSIKITEDVFRGCLNSSVIMDNTLPIVDKKPQLRYAEEKDGKWVLKSNGSYMVKDITRYKITSNISSKIFDIVKKYLGEEQYRIFLDYKLYKPFSNDNESTAIVNKVEKEFIDGDNKEIIILDIMGDEFDSEEKRKTVLKITTVERDKEYILNTNEGQLGN